MLFVSQCSSLVGEIQYTVITSKPTKRIMPLKTNLFRRNNYMARIALGLLALTSFLSASLPLPPSPVPEPSTYLMMGAGLGALIYARSKFGKKK